MSPKYKKRAFLVDDSAVVRKVLTQEISKTPDLEVAATAGNGRLALAKFPSLKPDVVLLDIEMPEMDGLETLQQLRKLDAHVPIIMFSTLTERGASITLEALSRGATDYLTKPSNLGASAGPDVIARELIPKIRALCHLTDPQTSPSVFNKPARQIPSSPPRLLVPAKIVVIGVSTGGPDALAHVLPLLPADFPVPLLIAQHMPPIFTTLLAARLTSKAHLSVRECVSGEPLSPGCALLAPGDYHMIVDRADGSVVLRTHQAPRENFCRPSVDVLFRSAAEIFGDRTLAVVLTGMGQDGLKGCEMLRNMGARIYVQDEASSVVWGMPGLIARAGLADKIVPLDQIASEITRATTLQVAASSVS